jgi:hypothetical protein
MSTMSTMNAENDEIQTKLLETMLAVMDLHEKFASYGSKEISALVTSAITSKTKKPAVINQLNKLETMLEDLRTSIAKASMRALLAAPKESKESKESEDPVAAAAADPEPKAAEEVKKSAKKNKEADAAVKEPAKPKKAEKAKEEVEEAPKTKSKKKEEPTMNVLESVAEPKAEKAVKPKKKAEEATPPPVPVAPVAPVVAAPVATVVAAAAVTGTAAAATPSPPAEDKSDEESAPLHSRRKNIPKHIKTMVWNFHMGRDNLEAKCFCCQAEKVDARSFQCGHVIAESKGGDLTIKNLRPICQPCNASMGTRSMNEFTKEYFGREV